MNVISLFLHHQPNDLTEFLSKVAVFFTKANIFSFERDLLVQFSGVIAGFISITLPIALDIVSRQTENYKDKEIAESFLSEPTYMFQVYGILPLAFFSIMIYAFGVTSGYLIWLIILLDAIAMVNFIFFIRVVQQYATNFDNYYSDKLKHEVDEIIRQEKEG